MSFDDADIQDEGCLHPCEACSDRMEREGPHPVLGWGVVGFTCARCRRACCEHLDAGGNVCVDCSAKATTRRMDPSKGSAHWPRVDGTVGDADVEYALAGSGWRAALLWASIAGIFVLMLWLVLRFGGGAR